MATPSGDHLPSNGVFQLEEEVVTIPGSDKQPNTDDVKVYSYDYSIGEQEIIPHDDGSAVSSDEDSESESRKPKRPASIRKTRQSDPQSQPAPTVLSLDDLDNEAQHLLNGARGQQNIRLLQSKSCAPAKAILTSIKKHLSFPKDLAAAILGSSPSNTPFVTGIRICGKFPEGNGEENSTLFVSVPYFGIHDAASGEPEESIKLSKFASTSDDLTPFVVHQAWFLVFGNDTVVTFQSKESLGENGSLPFPGQIRQGAFHVLAHMISGVFQSDKSILDGFRRKSIQHRCNLQSQTTNVALDPSLAGGFLKGRDIDVISKDLEVIVAAASVVRRQIRLLETLAKLLLSSSSSIIYPSPEPPEFEKIKSVRNIVKIPVVSQQTEQIPYAVCVIKQATKQRNGVLKELEEMATQMRIAYDGILRFAAPALPVSENRAVSEGAASEGAQSGVGRPGSVSSGPPLQIDAASGGFRKMEGLLEQILDQLRQSGRDQQNLLNSQLQSVEDRNNVAAAEAQELFDEMASQGDVMAWQADNLSWFAIVTFVFLPLGFFTQYFALDSAKSSAKTQGRFWMIVGPFTFLLVLGAVFMAFGKNYGMKEILSAIRQGRMPRDRQDVREVERKQRLAGRELRMSAGNNMAGSGGGARLLGNSSQGGTTGSRTTLPTHISNTEKRGSGIDSYTLAQSSASGQGSPQQTNSLSPGGSPGNFWSTRERPRTNDSSV